MKQQLLNFKMLFLVCLMVVVGGANALATDSNLGPDWNALFKTNYSGQISPLPKTLSGTNSDGVSIVVTTKANGYVKTNDFRAYSGYTFTITAPNNCIITSITSVAAGKTSSPKLNVDGGSVSIKDGTFSWTGSKNAVKFTVNSGIISFKTITVTYTEGQTKTLKSLAISGNPTNKIYNDGEEFDPTGLKVTGTYDDNSIAAITNGITWTKTPATLAVGTTSCSVTATVNGVTSPAYEVTGLTVVKSIKPIVFDFTANPNVWKITPLANNKKTGSNVIAGKELKVEGVVMTATNGISSGTCIYLSTQKGATPDLRVYDGGSITFTAPDGYNISEVDFTGTDLGRFSTADKAYENPTWSGNAHAITFNAKGGVKVKTATIKLVAATPVTPEVTSGTLEFKAVDDGIYYATFSSSKNVVFPKTNVDVYSYNVSNGKGTQNKLTEYYYEVTDATAGEEGLIHGYYVPANTGVLILSLNTTTPYYFSKNEETTKLPANQLKPALADVGAFTAETGYKYYKLAYDNYTAKTGLGFYWGAENGGAFKVKSGTAYLAVPTSDASDAKGFAFDGETTGIENVNVAANQNKTIYNLNGQRVSNMSQAGLYIVNGKKMVIRK